jgi:hypothetical protein
MFLLTALTLPISRSFCVAWLQANADLIRLFCRSLRSARSGSGAQTGM